MKLRSAYWLLVGLICGCGASGPALYPVQGTITLDGAPLENGLVRFSPTKGEAPAAGEIKGGRYSLNVASGEARVEITSTKVTGKRKAYNTPDSPLVEITKEAVPEKYNAKSELKHTVTAGPNTKDFELKGN